MVFSSDHNFTGNLEGQGENGFPTAPSRVDEPPPVETLCPGEPQNMIPITIQQAIPGTSQQIDHYIGMNSQNGMEQVFSGPGGMGSGGGGIVVDQHGQYPNASMGQEANMLSFQNRNMFYHFQQYCLLYEQQQRYPNQLLNQHQHQHFLKAVPMQHDNLSFDQKSQSQSQKQGRGYRQQVQTQLTAQGSKPRSRAKQKKTCVDSPNASLQPQQQGSYPLARAGQAASGSRLREPQSCFPVHSSSMPHSLQLSAATAYQTPQDPSYHGDPKVASHSQQPLITTSVSVPTTSTAPLTSTAPNLPGTVGQFPSTVSSTKACQPAQDPSYHGDPKVASHSQQPLITTSVSVPTTSTAPLTSIAPNLPGTVGQFPSTVSSTKACQPAQDPSYSGDPKIPSHSQPPLITTSVSVPTTSTAPLTSTAPNLPGTVGQFPSTVSSTKACQPAQDPSYSGDPKIPSHSQQPLITTSVSVPTTSIAPLTSAVPNLPGTVGQFPSTALSSTTVSKAEENHLQIQCYSGVSPDNSSMASPLRPLSYRTSLSLGDNLLSPDNEDLRLPGQHVLLPDLMLQLEAPPSQQNASEWPYVQSSQERGHEHRTSPVGYKVEQSECSTSDGKSDCSTSQSEVATGTTPEVGFLTQMFGGGGGRGGTSPASGSQPEMSASPFSIPLEETFYTYLEPLTNTSYNSNECEMITEDVVKPGDNITDSCEENTNLASCPPTSGVPTNHMFTKEQTLFIISQVEQHITSEGLGLPKNLAELNARLKSAKRNKKQFWTDIAEKLHSEFGQEFNYEKVTRKWHTLVEGYKRVKDNNKLTGKGTTRFRFYAEINALMDQNDEQNEVDPIIRTPEGLLQMCGPEALRRCSSVTPCAETTLSLAAPRQLAAKRKPEPSATPAPEPSATPVPQPSAIPVPESSATPVPTCKRRKWENEGTMSLREFDEHCQQRHEEDMEMKKRQLDALNTVIQLLQMKK